MRNTLTLREFYEKHSEHINVAFSTFYNLLVSRHKDKVLKELERKGILKRRGIARKSVFIVNEEGLIDFLREHGYWEDEA